MYTVKNIYFRDLLTDLYKKKILVILFIIASVVFFAFLGYRKSNAQIMLSEEQQEEIDTYNKRIEEYDKIIADVKESLSLADEQVAQLQEYVDNSIYMKLDSQNLQVASVQYGIITGGNVGNIYNALAYYINEGGLKEALAEEYTDLDVKYWREIIFCSLGGNVLNITIYHYDAEQAQKIMDIVKQRLLAQIPSVSAVHGEFSLQETDSSNYVKSDVTVVNTQNNNLNNLKNYISNRSDFTNKLMSQESGKNSYIEKNTPEVMEAITPNKAMIMITYIVAGILFGIVLPCVCFILCYILGNRIRSTDGLKEYGLPVIGKYSHKGQHQPDLNRSVMDLELLASQKNWSSVFLNALCEEDHVKTAVSEYQDALSKTSLSVLTGYHLEENPDELKNMVETGNCILFLEIARTTYPQLEAQINLCRKFGITIQGCVVIG